MELFGIDLIDIEDFIELIIRFTFNLAVVTVTVRYLYYSVRQRKEYFFTYILISVTVFLLCFLLDNVKLELGFALGLFAIFGIIRYRTRQIPIKEMTYLFLVIGMSVINALSNSKVSYAELLFTNLALLAATYTVENLLRLGRESRKVIRYERIDLIKPDKSEELKKDLEERTGLKITRIEIGNIDLLTDTARLNIYYIESKYVSESDDF
jgi:hypothetical protein